jgi:hypothetical protein
MLDPSSSPSRDIHAVTRRMRDPLHAARSIRAIGRSVGMKSTFRGAPRFSSKDRHVRRARPTLTYAELSSRQQCDEMPRRSHANTPVLLVS